MKKVAFVACVAGISMMMAVGCKQAANTQNADVQALKDLEAQWNLDYAAKDADKIAGHYADNAVLMVPGGPATAGKDAIRTALNQMVSDPTMTLKFQASKVDSAGDMGYTQGSYTLTLTDPQSKKLINDHGSYVTVYRKQADGTWKAVSDIASSAVPPTPPPAKAAKKHSKKHSKKH